MFKSSGSVASFGYNQVEENEGSASASAQRKAKSYEVLVVGAEGGGKSLLSRRLREANLDYTEVTLEGGTIPTVGSDMVDVLVNGKKVTFREVGSAMSSRWEKYLPDCDCLMYVVDISDPGSFASAWVLLNELLSNRTALEGKPILLVFNKTDIADTVVRTMAMNILRIEDLISMCMWMGFGTLFYSIYGDLGYFKGFYYAVNVGYSVGWEFMENPSDGVIVFSIVHGFVGASVVMYILGKFVEDILAKESQWYVRVIEFEDFMEASSRGLWWDCIILWFKTHRTWLRQMALVMIWIAGGTFVAYLLTPFSALEACFFSFSCLLTGGFSNISPDSSDFRFFCVACYAMVGIPLLANALCFTAAMLVTSPHSNTFKSICSRVTPDDVLTMQRLGLENRDGVVDRTEFIILCMLRLNVADPGLIQAIIERYNALDSNGDGFLTYAELLEEPSPNKVRTRSVSNEKTEGVPDTVPEVPQDNVENENLLSTNILGVSDELGLLLEERLRVRRKQRSRKYARNPSIGQVIPSGGHITENEKALKEMKVLHSRHSASTCTLANKSPMYTIGTLPSPESPSTLSDAMMTARLSSSWSPQAGSPYRATNSNTFSFNQQRAPHHGKPPLGPSNRRNEDSEDIGFVQLDVGGEEQYY